MKIIYLASGHAKLNIPGVIYQDKIVKRDLGDCMLNVDLDPYDIIIATPPCNFWIKANFRKDSNYSQITKHLLPEILNKLEKQKKPFIVENVINKPLMKDIILQFKGFYYEYGRHSYFTNVPFNMTNFNFPKSTDHNRKSRKQRQGSGNVNDVIEYFVKTLL